MRDSLGYLLIGLSVLFLIVVLKGHSNREHLTSQGSQWNKIRVSVENKLKETVDFDISKFRAAVLSQKTFFDTMGPTLESIGNKLSVPLGEPELGEVKDTEKLFDEKIRILTTEMEELAKKDLPDILTANTSGIGIQILKGLAKNYMIQSAIDVGTKPKQSSNILGR
jgi:hypothetical protein